MALEDLCGRKFGRLEALEVSGRHVFGLKRRHTEAVWRCRCACGEEVEIRRSDLLSGRKRYCAVGRHREDWVSALKSVARKGVKDGWLGHELTWMSWRKMLERCRSSGKYGPRGIVVCERWVGSFRMFLEDMGDRPSRGHSIERLDNEGDYEPGNCVWAVSKEQQRNKRTTVFVEVCGVRRKLVEVCEERGISRTMVYGRLKIGWSVEQALSEPVRPRRIKA